jgi:hypothetical protein
VNVESKTFKLDGSGNASGHIAIDVGGAIHALKIDYTGTGATTDLTITGGSGKQLYSKTNSNTDVTVYPRLPAQKADGTDSTLTEVAAVENRLNVAVAQGTAGGTVKIDVYVVT